MGRIRTDVGRADWWPRVTIELPKVWTNPVFPRAYNPMPGKLSTNPQAILPLTSSTVQADIQKSSKGGEKLCYLSPGKEERKPSECPYWKRCFEVLSELFQNAGCQLNDYSDPIAHMCFCNDCHNQKGDAKVYERGGKDYILPVGFARVDTKVFKSPDIIKLGLDSWHASFHGTQPKYLVDLLITGNLLAPGSTTFRGNRIAVRQGHIEGSFERKNEHTGINEIFDPTNKVFFSPTIKYCDYKGVYMSEHPSKGKKYRFALQLRLQPDTYQTGQETVNASEQIDPHIPNTSVEWYTQELHTHFFTGVLIGER